MEAHARLIIASSIETAGLPEEFLVPGTDIRHFVFDKLGIDEARRLTENSAGRPLGGGKHVFVVYANTIGLEAQNAMLKLFEEPPEDTIFFLIIPHQSLLIPTLRSRLVLSANPEKVENNDAHEFLKLTYADRLQMIADQAKKDPAVLERLVSSLGNLSHKELGTEGAKSLAMTDNYVRNRGASRKMLLEELALTLRVGK